MFKKLLLPLLLMLGTAEAAQPPLIWGPNNTTQTVTSGLNLNGKVSIYSGTQNPGSTATIGVEGDLFIQYGGSGGKLYIKQDNGTTTNWTYLFAGTPGTGTGDVLHTGNSFGADISLGTNDAYSTHIIAAGVDQMDALSTGIALLNDTSIENGKALKFKDSGSNVVSVKAPTTATTSFPIILPTSLPGSGSDCLLIDSSGQVTHSPCYSGISSVGSGTSLVSGSFNVKSLIGTNNITITDNGDGTVSLGETNDHLPGTGTVQSVNLSISDNATFAVSGGPISSSGVINLATMIQPANHLWAAPDNSNGTPIWRKVVQRDLSSSGQIANKVLVTDGMGGFNYSTVPAIAPYIVTTFNTRFGDVLLQADDVGGVLSTSPVTHNFLTGINSSGVFSLGQPDFTDLTGTATLAQITSSGASSGNVITYNGANVVWAAPGTSVNSVSNADGTLTISPTTGNVVASRAAITGDVSVPAASSTSTLATVNAGPGSYGSASSVANFTVNGKGLVTTAASTSIQVAESQVTNLVSDLAGKQATGNYITALTGDVTASGPGSAATTLATVNSNVGSFGSASSVANFTVNGKGLVTAAASTSIQVAESQVTNLVSDLAAKFTLPALTAGSVLLSDGTTITQDNGHFKYDPATFQLSLGGHLNTAALGISQSGGSTVGFDLNTTNSNTAMQVQNQGAQIAANFVTAANSATQGGSVILGASRGTTASRTASLAGDQIGLFAGQGYNSSNAFGPGYVGAFGFIATENQTSTHNGGEVVMASTANGALAPTVGFVLNQDQTVQMPHYTTNGFVKFTGAAGTLGVDTSTYLTANQSITLSGDVSGSGSTAITTTIGANKVANSQLAQAPTLTLKGNNTGGTANEADLTVAQVNTMLGSFVNPMTTGGDIIYGGSSGTATRLVNGTAGQVFQSAGGTSAPTWSGAADLSAQRSTSQTISGSSTTTVIYSTQNYADDITYDTSTGIATIHTTGTYSVCARVDYPANSSGLRSLDFTSTGTVTPANINLGWIPLSSGSQANIIGGCGSFKATAGDTFFITTFQNTGGTLNIAGSGATYNQMSAFRVK